MIVKVLCNSKGEYLKDVFLEDLSDPFDSTPAIGVAALWKTTDPNEAKIFRTSTEAIHMKSILRRDWDYKNIEICG